MTTERISVASTEYVKVQIEPPSGVSPSSDPVAFCFAALPELPSTPSWKTGSWQTITNTAGDADYFARCLIGPSSNPLVQLDVGRYYVFVKVTDNPAIPVKLAGGQLEIY